MTMYIDIIMEQITTFDGTTAFRKDCRFIKGEYYEKNRQCFCIDGKWYRINSGYIVYDHYKKEYVLSNSLGLTHGIVNINSYSGIAEFGYFSGRRKEYLMLFCENNLWSVLSEDLLSNCSNIREGMNGYYYFANDYNVPKDFVQKIKPRKEGFYPFPFNYGSDPLIPEFSEKFRAGFVGQPLISSAYKYLGDYTFGVEFETERGAIPLRYIENSGLIPCRDGSISGFEYATIPLYGESGIQSIKNSCDLLTKYCACSVNESTHIHVGGYPRTVKSLAALYKLAIAIEDEIYSLFPYYYADTSKFKRKGYCNPLPKFYSEESEEDTKMLFHRLYEYLSGGSTFTRFPSGAHPMDRSGQHKWDISPRYLWLNTIPIIWGNRGTVEFRCHTPTTNSQKVINWLFIVVAILKYANKHTNDICAYKNSVLALTLEKILYDSYPNKIAMILCKYISDRKIHYHKKSDPIGEIEIKAEHHDEALFTLTPFV